MQGSSGSSGHNGAGKTTLLKMVAGLVAPTSGELEVNGIDVVRDPAALKVTLGYLPEESRLYETMTAENYLAFFGEIYGIPKNEITVRTRRLFAALSLETGGKKLGEFSKGMKRKAAIARSLIHDPAFLVYDEPTSGLDPMTSRFIAGYLKDLKNSGKTIVLSAHNLYQVEAICDRVMILRRGKIVADGTMDRAPQTVRLDHVHRSGSPLPIRPGSTGEKCRTVRTRPGLPAMPRTWRHSTESLQRLRQRAAG